MAAKSAPAVTAVRDTRARSAAVVSDDVLPAALPADALDDRIAIVGTAGSGKTYAAKGFVERLLETGARIAIVDPLGVWWGLRASADGSAPGYPVIVFGGRHADVPITAESGAALGRLIAAEALVCVVDLSELGSNAARRRFMAAFAEALYEANKEPLHLVLDEADLWAPQRPLPDQTGLLGHIEEIVRRGRVRGFIPWLITQRPAVVHKDVLSQADILIAMKLTASQDRDAIGGWIEGQADRQEGKRILGDLPRLQQGEGYLWAPGRGILERAAFPAIRTFDSSRTPKRGERLGGAAHARRGRPHRDRRRARRRRACRRTEGPSRPISEDRQRQAQLERELAAAKARIETLEQQNRELAARLAQIAALAADRAGPSGGCDARGKSRGRNIGTQGGSARSDGVSQPADELPRIRRRDTSGSAQIAECCGAARARAVHLGSAGHACRPQAERRAFQRRAQEPAGSGYIAEDERAGDGDARQGQKAAGEVPPAPSTPAERLTLWCGRLPSPAPEILRALAAQGERYIAADELAAMLGKKPTGGHWNSGIAVLRNNGLIEAEPAPAAAGGKCYRIAALFRE